jgi:hypothetical protein|tara:strand:+ start:633 stop:812 length:180 start_codon:yes stop_codon:yes gene_type:complete
MSILSKYAERNIKKFIASKIGKLGKKGAILWAVGFIVKHTPTKKDDAMFEVVKKALKKF